MKIYQIVLIIASIVILGCQKAENDEALIKGIQKDCLMSKFYINGKIYREYEYNENLEIDHQKLFNANGQILTRINYVYANGKIIQISDNSFVQDYTYNDKNLLVSSTACEKNSNLCCFISYDYEQGILVKSRTEECNNGYYLREVYEYLNKENGMRYVRAYDKSGRQIKETDFFAFNEKLIWPYYFVQAEYKDPYLGIFSLEGGIIDSYEANEYNFPLKLKYTDGREETFEYLICK